MSENAKAELAGQIKRPPGPMPFRYLKSLWRPTREIGYEERRVLEMGAGLEEAVDNILRFACADGSRTISVECTEHEMGMLIIEIRDTGTPFNMLVASSFPSTADFVEPGQQLSTVKTKKVFKK